MTAPVRAPADLESHPDPEPETTGGFSAYAVQSRTGPHLTLQAGVVHAGRFWTTTSGRSLKARSVREHRTASVVVEEDDGRCRVLAGRTNGLRPFRPFDALRDPLAPLRSPAAVLRLGVGQVEQLIGYFESARRVPADWLPHRRVLLVTRIDRSLTLDGLDVVETTGTWARRAGSGRLDPTAHRPSALPLDSLPSTHRGVVTPRAHLGLTTPDGPVALPARWRDENRFEVSAAALGVVRAELPGRASAVFDESVSRRPDEKRGAMFRGRAVLSDVDGPHAIVLLETERLTTWDGFRAETVDVS